MNSRITLILFIFFIICLAASSQEKIHVNFDLRHTVGGEDTFDRKKWMTVHSSNYEGAWEGEIDKIEYLLNELDVYLTRETGSITTEVSNRSATEIENNAANYKAQYAALTDRHQFEAKQNLIVANQHRIYEEMNAEEAGARSAAFLNNYFGSGGADGMPAPTYLELLNEPVYPLFDFGDETLQDIFDYHRGMAQKVKELSPNTPVGGYVGAFSIFEEDNFGRWNDRWKKYIDEVGDDMDFYSWHLYDFPGINNGTEQYRKGANNEATFDMMEHYSWLVDKERPFVISEYGSQLHDWYEQNWTSFRDWLFIKATNSMLMGFLERPDKMAVALPFTVIKAQWGYGAFQMGESRPYPWRMMRQETEPESYTVSGFTGDWVWTEYIKFYELWKDVNGTRVDSKSDNINILVDSYINGDKAYLIINSLVPDSIDFQPDIKGLGTNGIANVSVRNLYFDPVSDQVKLDVTTEAFSEDKVYRLFPEATMIFEYDLNEAMTIDQTSEETKYYATTYLQPISTDQEINFSIENVTLVNEGEAVLRIGVGRDLDKSLNPEVTINGKELEAPILYRGDNQEERPRFFGVLEMEVPYDFLQATNTIGITFPDEGGHVSSLAMQVFNFTRPVTRTAIQGFEILNDEVTIATGKTRQLIARFTPETVGNKGITWSSDNPSIASVNDAGLVSGVAEGTTTINAVTEGTDESGNTFMASTNVTVQAGFVLLMDSIVFSNENVQITIGESLQLLPQIFPEETDDQTLLWSSSNESIVSVDANGEIGGGSVGTATITASAQDGSNVTGSIEVEVVQASFIAFDDQALYTSTDYLIGESIEINCTYNAGNTETVDSNGIKFWLREITEGFGAVVKDYTVEIVSAGGTSSGTVTGSIQLTEEVTPTADLPEGNFYFLFASFFNTNGDFIETGTFPLNIVAPIIAVEGITLNEESITLIEEETATLVATVMPSNASDQTVIWSSTDESIVTVNQGMVTAENQGTAIITASSGGNSSKSASATVTVTELVVLQSITLIPDQINLAPGETLQLQVTYQPDNASYQEITWNSSNTAVATVNQEGVLTAIIEGTSLISVTSDRYPDVMIEVQANIAEPLSYAEKGPIRIYPNPAKQYLRIDGLGDMEYSAKIVDLNGKVHLLSEMVNEQPISIQGIEAGIYQLIIQSSNKTLSYKLILE